ncbi:MAG TPA: hypothetical protein VFI84_02005, partial [Candidatus Saccharimonadales bacterium]|nr:hypothetical protein [Candidatus Saccharimonadales bacterium]
MIDDIRPAGAPLVPEDSDAPQTETATADGQSNTQHPAVQAELAKTSGTDAPAGTPTGQVIAGGKRAWRKPILLVVLLLLVGGGAYYWYSTTSSQTSKLSTGSSAAQKAATAGTTLDTAKNYGNKYSNGILPVGDGKYKTTGAQQGYVYACSGYAQNLAADSGGAGRRGPWFSSDGTTYDINKKTHVNGNVAWQASFSNTLNGSTRTITTNDLPNHTTGVFPIAASDPAYAYDRNPNTISAQNLVYSLPVRPTYGSPQCMGGQAG